MVDDAITCLDAMVEAMAYDDASVRIAQQARILERLLTTMPAAERVPLALRARYHLAATLLGHIPVVRRVLDEDGTVPRGPANKARAVAVMMFAALAPGVPNVAAQVDPRTYVNFEGAQTSPIRLSSDGRRLFAVNTPDARLSVFDLNDSGDSTVTPSTPRLIAEIPVGIEPVSVNPRTSDEAWVVNQESDTISVISVSRGIVTDTIYVRDEPADVVFAGSLAFVTVARSNEVRVFDAVSHHQLRIISLLGRNPRAMALNPSNGRLYVTFALSGNRTTLAPASVAPLQPAPTNPALPAPPRVGLIIDAAEPAWAELVTYTMPDHDVAEIDVRSLKVTRYFSNVGTVNLGIAVQPFTGNLFVANTDARNRTRFEPDLRGQWVDNRITRVTPQGVVTAFNLNPTIDAATLPNPAARAIALAQPTAVVFEPLGRFMYVAAFGTDRVAVVTPTGQVLARIDVAPSGAPEVDTGVRGPRGLALNATARRLYVLNRISNTISLLDVTSNRTLREFPVGRFDPTPHVIRAGRRFLYDAKLSGNGTGACASCHVDAEMDLLAWDLGNPRGEMQTVVNNGVAFEMHPMKGPMLTQSLRGLLDMAPYHWRADRATFQDFSGAFESLMGGERLSDPDMAAYTAFVNTIKYMPNPHQQLDRSLPPTLIGGDPRAGLNTFMFKDLFPGREITCNSCHAIDHGGTDLGMQSPGASSEAFKNAPLRNVYQRLGFERAPGAVALDGFGFSHDGVVANIFDFLGQPLLGELMHDPVGQHDLAAFLMAFDTGMAPAVGFSVTITAANVDDGRLDYWSLLAHQAATGNIDLIAKGRIAGAVRGLVFQPETAQYHFDTRRVAALGWQQILNGIRTAGDVVTFMGVPRGSGMRMGVDRDLDGVLDGDQP